ncbi:MAG: cation diffusion facilitator family transporter [Actinomycetota bacterium]
MAGERLGHDEKEFRSKIRRLELGIVLGVVLVAAEAVAGILIHSLALVSDAGHNAADIFAVGLALFAVFMAARPATERRSYGFGRVGILTALVNAVALVAVGGVLVYEAVYRIGHIKPVSGPAMMLVSVVAVFINSIVAIALFEHRHDLSVKAAFVHQVTDAAVSLGVLLAGFIIWLSDWYYADPIIALVISVAIFHAAWGIVRDATDVLLESVPRHLDVAHVREVMESVPGVDTVHHLHIWELGSGVYALSGHVEVEDRMVSACSCILADLQERLREEFNIIHPTLQVECAEACPTTPPE